MGALTRNRPVSCFLELDPLFIHNTHTYLIAPFVIHFTFRIRKQTFFTTVFFIYSVEINMIFFILEILQNRILEYLQWSVIGWGGLQDVPLGKWWIAGRPAWKYEAEL